MDFHDKLSQLNPVKFFISLFWLIFIHLIFINFCEFSFNDFFPHIFLPLDFSQTCLIFFFFLCNILLDHILFFIYFTTSKVIMPLRCKGLLEVEENKKTT